MQKFWKSAKIRQSYRQLKGGNFFETQCIVSGAKRSNNDVCTGFQLPAWIVDLSQCAYSVHAFTLIFQTGKMLPLCPLINYDDQWHLEIVAIKLRRGL